MPRRTQSEWFTLFEEQQTSGLNYTDFCKTKNISPKYFSLRRSQLKPTTRQLNNKQSKFIVAKVQPITSFICIEHRQTKIKLPNTVSTHWLSLFVQQLNAL